MVPETKPPADSAVTLYHAGVEADGGYWLDDVYGGGLVRWGDLPSLTLASWLAEHEAAEGTTVPFDAEGSATFSNLSPGLYLIKQTGISAGNDAIPPFVIELPYEDIWEITVSTTVDDSVGLQKLPPTGQEPTPIIAALVLVVSGMGLLGVAANTKRKRDAG
ncbi:MAG: hypothetical protein V8T48_00315 [Oscillospiraceae bacterium]